MQWKMLSAHCCLQVALNVVFNVHGQTVPARNTILEKMVQLFEWLSGDKHFFSFFCTCQVKFLS